MYSQDTDVGDTQTTQEPTSSKHTKNTVQQATSTGHIGIPYQSSSVTQSEKSTPADQLLPLTSTVITRYSDLGTTTINWSITLGHTERDTTVISYFHTTSKGQPSGRSRLLVSPFIIGRCFYIIHNSAIVVSDALISVCTCTHEQTNVAIIG